MDDGKYLPERDIVESGGVGYPRKWRWLRVLVTALLALGILWIGLSKDSPVGHFTSILGRDRFMAAYQRAMADLPQPAATFDLRTSYGVVRMYRFAGAHPDRPPLLLLPGRASASPVWADNLPALLAQRSVYTIDLLGEPGQSVQNCPIRNGDDQARWLHEAIAALPEDSVHLVGMSIGGWTAMNLAIREPGKIASLTLLDPVMTFTRMSVQAIVRSIPASVRWFPKSWRDGFTSWAAGGATVRNVPVAEMIESGMAHYALQLPAPQRFSADQLRKLQVPTLVIMAGKSVMHDSAKAARVARKTLTHATVRTYPKASHAINGEYPEQIANDLTAFLAASGVTG
jgi:pimeloyl-ACP methyl ester carboxylesterase